MPSVEQMVNEIKTILAQIETNTSLAAQQDSKIREDTDALNAGVASLLAVTEAGFGKENHLLEVNDAQNRTIICWLSKIADMACEQIHRLDRQIELQESIDRSTHTTLQIAELVHAREALEVEREHELIAKIEKCCPPKRPEPKPCFEPCVEQRPPSPTSEHGLRPQAEA